MSRHPAGCGEADEESSLSLAMFLCMSGQRVLVLVDTEAFCDAGDVSFFSIGELPVNASTVLGACAGVPGAAGEDSADWGDAAKSLATWSCSLASWEFCQLRTVMISGWMGEGCVLVELWLP